MDSLLKNHYLRIEKHPAVLVGRSRMRTFFGCERCGSDGFGFAGVNEVLCGMFFKDLWQLE